MPIQVEFDDIIYRLQRFGGASEYWSEVTSRTAADVAFAVTRRSGHRRLRCLPVPTRPGVFHSSHFRVGLGRGVRNVATVHDLIYELGMAGSHLGARFNTFERRQCYFACEALICVSRNTRDDLLKVYPGLSSRRIEVVPHGLASDLHAYLARREAATPPQQTEAPAHVLYVGGRQSYKNFPGALDGFLGSGLAREGVRLICTGGAFKPEETALIDQLGLTGCVVSAGFLEREDLFRLYESALALLYSSTYEGFGLPVLEAMALNCPVVACHISSIPEVAGDVALLVAPNDAAALAGALREISRQSQADRRAAGVAHAAQFSWDRSATLHMDIYRHMAAHA